MSQTYNDPTKEKARGKQRDFIKRNLLSFKDPKQIRVVCFPGAEVDGEAGLEITSIYDPLGIPRSNITGIEADPKKAQRLRESNLGIRVFEGYDLDFFRQSSRQYDVISLDYTGNRSEDKWKTLHQIAGREQLYGNGVLCTNYSAYREGGKTKRQIESLQGDAFMKASGVNGNERLQELWDELDKGNIDLTTQRDNLSLRLINILRMGTSSLEKISLLESHPTYEYVQEELKKMEREQREQSPERFSLDGRIDLGEGEWGPSHHFSFVYRDFHMRALSYHIEKVNGIRPNAANFFMNFFVYGEMDPRFPRVMERYGYTSNKGTPMEMDLVATISYDRTYKGTTGKFFYRPETGVITTREGPLFLNKENGRRNIRHWKDVLKSEDRIHTALDFEIPEREHLGSSYNPKPRAKKLDPISKAEAVDLLKAGVTPSEIAETFSGHTKMQLAALKAHYVTMGKEFKD